MFFMKKYISGYVVKKVQNVKLGRFQSSFHRRKLKLNLDTSFTPTLTMEPVDSSEKEKKRNIPIDEIKNVFTKNLEVM